MSASVVNLIFEETVERPLVHSESPLDLASLVVFPPLWGIVTYVFLARMFSPEQPFRPEAVTELLPPIALDTFPLAAGLLFLALRANPERRAVAEQEVYNKISTVQQSSQAADIHNAAQASKDLDDLNYRKNIRALPRIESFAVSYHPMFKNLDWRFNDRVNVLLGRNGFGKSFLLRIMVALLSNDSVRITDDFGRRQHRARSGTATGSEAYAA
jgi:hypothetical protein